MRTLAPSNNRHNVLHDRWAIPSVDQVMVEERAGALAKRSVKTSAKLQGLKLAISMMDLTTLEGKDTPGKIASLCQKATQPLGPRYEVPSCAEIFGPVLSVMTFRTPRKKQSNERTTRHTD